jgi:uncharacterized protein YcfJ
MSAERARRPQPTIRPMPPAGAAIGNRAVLFSARIERSPANAVVGGPVGAVVGGTVGAAAGATTGAAAQRQQMVMASPGRCYVFDESGRQAIDRRGRPVTTRC